MNNNFLTNKKELKNGLGKKAISTLLAGSMIFGSGVLTKEVEAKYSLDAPKQSYEDFLGEDIKIFINGRNVEFNDSLGYPYIENGTTMIPLRVVAETFGAYVDYNAPLKRVHITKNEDKVVLTIGENKIEYIYPNYDVKKSKALVAPIIKNGRTYVPLRAVFELFGMDVNWDQSTKTAHITTKKEDLNMIDFKGKPLIDLNNFNLNSVNKVLFDEVEINKDYINVLKNTNQYMAIIDNNVLKIYSYQFLRDINFVYNKASKFSTNPDEDIMNLGTTGEELYKFVENFIDYTVYDRTYHTYSTETSFEGTTHYMRNSTSEEDYDAYRKVLKEYIDIINSTCTSDKEKVDKAIELITNNINYRKNIEDTNGHSDLYNAYVKNKAVCQGFAASFKVLMDELHIPCLKVLGYRHSVSFENLHMWNEVCIDGEWFALDTTGNSDKFKLSKPEDYYIENYTKTYIIFDDEEENLNQIKLTYRFN